MNTFDRARAIRASRGLHPDIPREDVDKAYLIGVAKWDHAEARGARHKYKYNLPPEKSRHFDGMSAVSERAVEFVTGRRWLSNDPTAGPDAPGAGDIEGGINVRWTPLDHGALTVYKEDEEPFYLLVLGPDRYNLRIFGWMTREEAQQPEYWRREGPVELGGRRYNAYFVPQRDLWKRGHEIDELIIEGRGRGYGGEGGHAC